MLTSQLGSLTMSNERKKPSRKERKDSVAIKIAGHATPVVKEEEDIGNIDSMDGMGDIGEVSPPPPAGSCWGSHNWAQRSPWPFPCLPSA